MGLLVQQPQRLVVKPIRQSICVRFLGLLKSNRISKRNHEVPKPIGIPARAHTCSRIRDSWTVPPGSAQAEWRRQHLFIGTALRKKQERNQGSTLETECVSHKYSTHRHGYTQRRSPTYSFPSHHRLQQQAGSPEALLRSNSPRAALERTASRISFLGAALPR
ncbi:hypothetical protein SRHO_G00189470 [Serrasalmus rhombeus]